MTNMLSVLLIISVFFSVTAPSLITSLVYGQLPSEMGLRFEPPPQNWEYVPFARPCSEPIEICGVGWRIVDTSFNPSYSAGIIVVSLNQPVLDTPACNCNNLLDFVNGKIV